MPSASCYLSCYRGRLNSVPGRASGIAFPNRARVLLAFGDEVTCLVTNARKSDVKDSRSRSASKKLPMEALGILSMVEWEVQPIEQPVGET